MPADRDLGDLNSSQWEKLHQAVNQFEEACQGQAMVDLARFLPAPGDPLRSAVLQELVKSDLEHRWSHGHAVDLEYYLDRFPELGSPRSVSPRLVFEEYWARQRYGDKLGLEAYQRRFPNQFPQLQRYVEDTLRPADSPVPGEPVDPAQAVELHPGDVLDVGGGYKLIEMLGGGNFGQVWKAEAAGGKQVAVKILTWPLDHPAAQRELKSLELIKQLNHTYLLDLHAIFTKHDQLIIAMELAESSLHDRLRKCKEQGLKGIPADELIGYIAETAEVLDYLHSHQIQHRDIKPANILLSRGHVQVGDLGLARAVVTQVLNASVLGTPPYMAPEVWLGTVHSNSDQYSLAITYVHLRRGVCPFKNANLDGLQPEHLEDTAGLAPLKETEKRVLLRAGAKEPDKRYPSCEEFVSALRQSLTPSVVIGYRKVQRIGRGSYGEVWKAEAPGGIPVAVKVITLGDQQKSKSEMDALELVKKLAHNYLVRIYAFWFEEDELNIAMELADGSLRDRFEQCRREGKPGIPREELLDYLWQAAQGLDYLHEHKVIHRDIKPENILLQGKFAKVADFGVARFIQSQHLFTATTSGTMAYMPPEVWKGKASIHSDQYSLAAAYVELYTGRRPFPGESLAGSMEAHLSKPPSLAGLPQDEQKVLRRALAKDPEERFPTCLEFVEALRKVKPLTAPAASPDGVRSTGTLAPSHTIIPTDAPTHPKLVDMPVQVPLKERKPAPPPVTTPLPPEKKKSFHLPPVLWLLVPVLALVGILVFVTIKRNRVDVAIASNPPGATVLIDHTEQSQKTDSVFRLAPGKHLLRLELAEYRPVEQEIDVPAGGLQLPPFELVRKGKARVVIRSEPPDADVTIDDKKREWTGKTDPDKGAVFELEPGTYQLELRWPGNRTKKVTLKVKDDKDDFEETFSPDESTSLPGGRFTAVRRSPQRRALLVGVSQPCADLPAFLHADPDVKELGRTLVAAGFDPDNVVVLTQALPNVPSTKAPTVQNLRAELAELAKQSQPDDTLVVALAGHQVWFPGGPDGIFFCADGSLLANHQTLLPMTEVYKALMACRAKTRLLLLDGWQHAWSREVPRPCVVVRRGRAPGRFPDQVHVLCSCLPEQESYDHLQLRHGVFFHFVCRGLQGEAADGDGNVTWKRLTGYVRRQVSDYVAKTDYATQALGVQQEPEVRSAAADSDPVLVAGANAVGLKLYNEGYRQVDGKTYLQAIKTLTAAAGKLSPDFVEVYLKRAEAFYLGKDYDAAIEDCRRVLQRDASCAAAYDLLADAFMKKEDFTSSIAHRKKAQDLEPTYALAYNSQGLTYAKIKDYKKAIPNYQRALRWNPYLKGPYVNLFTAYVLTKNQPSAILLSQDALRLYPQWDRMLELQKKLQ
jgi:serine/threonine protein kinase